MEQLRSAYVMTDLEGVAGVVSFDHVYPDGAYYNQAWKLQTAEVNATIDNLLTAEVERILVADGQGN